MSPRAACRLDHLGFSDVYEYVDGKLDWLARGLPTEGTNPQPRLVGKIHDDVVTCALREDPAAVRERIDASPYGFALVVSAGRVVLGRLRRSALEADGAIEELMEPGPSTVRATADPHQLAARLAERDLRFAVVTAPDGVLLGVVRREELEG
jgi:hypothetical protein